MWGDDSLGVDERHRQSVELTYDEVRCAIMKNGFNILEGSEAFIETTYTSSGANSMRRTVCMIARHLSRASRRE